MSQSLRVTGKARRPSPSHAPACVVVALASCFTVQLAGAQETTRAPSGHQTTDSNLDLARSVAITGREAFNAGAYETALALFRRAHTLYPAPTVALYEARTLEKMGLFLEAVAVYERTIQMPVHRDAPAQFAEAITAAQAEQRELQGMIPQLTVKAEGVLGDDPGLTVAINGRPLATSQIGQPQKLNPGRYRLVGSVGGGRIDQTDVVLRKAQNATVTLRLHEVSPEDLSPAGEDATEASSSELSVPLLAYAAGGVGVLGIGSGVVTGLMASGKHDEAERHCPSQQCTPGTPGLAAADAFRTLRGISTISYGVGAAGVAVGLVLWLTADDEAEGPTVGSIEPWGSTNTAGIRGTF